MHGISWFKFFVVNGVTFAPLTALVWVLLAFLAGRRLKRHSVIDVFWGPGFLVIYLESLIASHQWSLSDEHDALVGAGVHGYTSWWSHFSGSVAARYELLAVVAVWSLRLGGYLAWRQRGHGEDSRYVAIMRGAKGQHETRFAITHIYLLQGALLWFISLPLQFAAFVPRFWMPAVIAGVAIALVGFGFEATGDAQLRRFVRNPLNANTTMSRGLWRYTRHPNYFGDAVVWWGFFTVAASSGWGALTFLSPLAMTILLTSVSGRPMTEAKLRRTRVGYEEYISSTSSFLPRRPKTAHRVQTSEHPQ